MKYSQLCSFYETLRVQIVAFQNLGIVPADSDEIKPLQQFMLKATELVDLCDRSTLFTDEQVQLCDGLRSRTENLGPYLNRVITAATPGKDGARAVVLRRSELGLCQVKAIVASAESLLAAERLYKQAEFDKIPR